MMAGALKPREQRMKVILPARLKDHRGWHDVRILNISSQGLMARSPAAPARGAYLELRRGGHVIVARVVWSNGQQFGARSQARLVPSQIIEERPAAGAAAIPADSARHVERRLLPRRPEGSHDESRWRARALEFGGILALVAGLAILALDVSQQAFDHSLKSVDSSLGSTRPS